MKLKVSCHLQKATFRKVCIVSRSDIMNVKLNPFLRMKVLEPD